jgi:DNA-binding transcriptional ArsR family regulator
MDVLADRTRLCLLLFLAGGESNVKPLCERLGCGQPTCSHHLGILRRARFVTALRRGKEVYYRLGPKASSPAPSVLEIADVTQIRITVPRAR